MYALTGWLVLGLTASAAAGDVMPVPQQNALVEKYCAVCHTDAAPKGGLSLEHFDAAQVPPGLAAMMLSKLTGGASLATAREALSNPVKHGGMGVADFPIADQATIDAWIGVLTVQSRGATGWTVERSKDDVRTVTASMVQESATGVNAGEAELYRLLVSCNLDTREGQMRVVWSPVPRSGRVAASVDGGAAVPYRAEGSENMANAVALLTGAPFPANSLKLDGLFPEQSVTFSFASLPKDAREQLTTCFASRGLK